MTGTCLCGAVSVTIPEKPDFIHDCNCSLCRKSGGAWGYFPSSAVDAEGQTFAFTRNDKAEAAAELQTCPTCGATTHFVLSAAFRARNPGADVVGVNMRLFDPADLDGVEVRYPNGADWSGAGEFTYRRPAMTIGAATPL